MVVQNQSELGKGSANPTDPHHTPTIIQSLTQHQKTQKPRKPKRKDTHVPQPSDPSENVIDKAVYKELGDSLVTLNESSSLGTTSGGGLRCQETIRDTTARTRFESVFKHSNDSLLARGNTLRSDEDRLKLNELMELCTTLQQRVLDLEKTKTTHQNEINSLKRRVKKLKKKRSSRTYKLKRLNKVGLSTRVESSSDEESLGKDASKQGRKYNAIDVEKDITLVNVQDDVDNEMFDVDALNGEEVFVAGQNENVVKEVVNVAQVKTAATTVIITTEEITLAQALESLKTSKPKVKGIVFQEPGKSTTTTISSQQSQDKGKGILIEEPVKPMKKKIDAADYQLAERLQAEEQEQFIIEEKATLFKELLEQRRKHFAAKRAEEKRNKPPTKTQQKKIMITYLNNMEGWKHKDLKSKDFDSIKELFDKTFIRVNMFVDFRTKLVKGSSKRADTELEQQITKKKKVDDVLKQSEVDDESRKQLRIKVLMEIVPDEEEIAIDAIPLAVKPPRIIDWKIHRKGKKSYYQIVRADGKSQMYLVFSHMLKSFDREDLKDLYKLVKARYGSTRPVEDLDLVLWNDLKNMFEPHVEDVKNIKFRGGLLGLKVFLMLFGVTTALIDVNAAQSKLVLLENFNENYSKFLRLLVKLQLPVQSYYC
ncbi:hypothetical protein Tco_0540844 [Tanacetum coccineum]